ncbi:MAG: RDD family protein [Actinobacteria bacterium]|nr:RDD family protein [Actinomycetota bacterium]
MSTMESRGWAESPLAAALASLIPWVAFFVAASVADAWVDDRSGSLAGLAAAAPFYLGFVALPSLLPLLAARTALTRLIVLVVMTAVAAISAVLVATSNDGQAGLAVLWVLYVAIPLAVLLWVGHAAGARRACMLNAEPLAPAGPSDRLAALAIDVVILGSALLVPLTAMSRAKYEVAAALVGVTVGTIYMATLVALRRRTVGQSVLGLAVVDATTLDRVDLPRAIVRSAIIVIEVAAAATIILSVPAIAELVSVLTSGRSLTDRLLRTSVVTDMTTK